MQISDIHPYDERALRLAADNGHLSIVKYLIDMGADYSVLGDKKKLQAEI